MFHEYSILEKFAEWLINSKKLADWHKDKLYDEFLLLYVKKEPGIRALERTIIYLSRMGQKNNKDYFEYFKEVFNIREMI